MNRIPDRDRRKDKSEGRKEVKEGSEGNEGSEGRT
jgi:hypothetical protein